MFTTMPVVNIDPYESDGVIFECVACGARTEAASNPGACNDCGGEVRNLSVHQE
jgi:hypothetical protein